tara:strand:- start:496 stop:741 length:246 start_codon:yes stop_codon:yes gene_type:complete
MARTADEKNTMYNAMVGMITVIDNTLDDSNDYGSDLTNVEKQKRVLRTSGYLEYGLEFADYGSKTLTAIEAAVTKAKAYTP